LYRSLAETLAKLHNVTPWDVALGDYGKAGNYFSRQIARWRKQWNYRRPEKIRTSNV